MVAVEVVCVRVKDIMCVGGFGERERVVATQLGARPSLSTYLLRTLGVNKRTGATSNTRSRIIRSQSAERRFSGPIVNGVVYEVNRDNRPE